MSIVYKVVSEWSSPTYYDVGTNEELYNECSGSEQCLWVVTYDTDSHEIEEWVERFEVFEEEQAQAMADELNNRREL